MVAAHSGDGVAGFAAGFAHPWTGVDHLLAMLAVGVVATIRNTRPWLVPLIFVCGMALGAVLGHATGASPLAEWGIAASLLVLGAAVALYRRLPGLAGPALVVAAAMAHGHAHGAEAGAAVDRAGYGAGMLLATAVLHALGVALGALGRASLPVATGLRIAGAGTAVVGTLAIAGLIG
ncbi:MAG: HupE/UreJ family protein [Arhodomonas sp.]|nr:HupE/UreJ family protein [Arhodomonas sp.]